MINQRPQLVCRVGDKVDTMKADQLGYHNIVMCCCCIALYRIRTLPIGFTIDLGIFHYHKRYKIYNQQYNNLIIYITYCHFVHYIFCIVITIYSTWLFLLPALWWFVIGLFSWLYCIHITV